MSEGSPCTVPGCANQKASGHLMCWAHWGVVSRETRNRAWLEFKKIMEARRHGEPTKAAIDAWRRAAADACLQVSQVEGVDLAVAEL